MWSHKPLRPICIKHMTICPICDDFQGGKLDYPEKTLRDTRNQLQEVPLA